MAMVFKSKKKSLEKIEKDINNPGPGEYLPLTFYKNININKEPFLSAIKKLFIKEKIIQVQVLIIKIIPLLNI